MAGNAVREASDAPVSGLSSVVEMVQVAGLREGFSPRLGGVSVAYAERLAASGDAFPPIVVQRSSMRVVDGEHRLRAARLHGCRAVPVVFFDGSDEEAFVVAVRLNAQHGLPLTAQDRTAAASRILAAYPHWSDRRIASMCQVAPRTVAAMRQCSTDGRTQLDTRLGRDGRRRPLSALEGRRRAAGVMRRRPEASLREVARESGISVGTAMDVRRQLAAMDAGVPSGQSVDGQLICATNGSSALEPETVLRAALQRLVSDPSLRYTERGRVILRLASATLAFIGQSESVVDATPGHCRVLLRDMAEACARGWHDFGQRLVDADAADRAA